jgi:hypothetical protein
MMNSIAAKDKKNSPPSTSSLMDDGNKLLSKGQFSAALSVWQKVIAEDANNANANFKLGMCYYNSVDEQTKALPYLRKAAKNTSPKYDFFSTSEKTAPMDALYFLAHTYLTANLADSAMYTAYKYSDMYDGKPPIPVEMLIRNSINAKNANKAPRDVTMKNPGKNVNSSFCETNPVVTLDNSVMFFASRRAPKEGASKQLSDITGKFDEDIYYTQKDAGGKWHLAIPFRWNTTNDEAPLCWSADGLTLYLTKEVDGQSDIFVSTFVERQGWSEPKGLTDINTSANETGLSISADGNFLYFCSDKEGGNGKFDIYQCVKQGKHWSKPKNLGVNINTSMSEISPFINPNGKALFFSSNGYKDGMGGYDVFYTSLKDDGTWTKPETIGFPINTTRDDVNFYVIGGGLRYYSTVRDEGDGYDIFKIEGGSYPVENIEAGGQIVTLTKEMSVTDVIEVQKVVEKEVDVIQTIETTVEVVKEVEKIDPVKEKMRMDSMRVLARNETQLEKTKMETDKAVADAERAKAEAAIKTAEAEKMKADAEIKKADAAKALADADRAKSEAAKSKTDAEKAKADAVIAAAQKAKDELAKAKLDADNKKTEAAIASSNAAKAKSEADKAKSEENKAKAETDKIKLATDKAKADESALQLKNQLAETEKPKYEAMKAKADADKVNAEADKLKTQETLAAAQKAKDEASKAKSDADAAKAASAAAMANALAEQKIADAEKAKAQATIAAADKAKADADKAASMAAKSATDAQKAASDAEAKKAAAEIAAADKAKADAQKADAQAAKAASEAEKAKTDFELKKTQLELLKLQTPKPTTPKKTDNKK